MFYCRQHTSHQNRRKRSGEDEPGRIRADDIDDPLVRRDIAAHHAECLAQCPFDDRHAVGHAIALGNAAATRTVHAHRMDFVAIGERVIFVGKIANRGNWCDVAVHRIDAFERYQFGRVFVVGGQQFFEMRKIIMPPHPLFTAGIADARNH